MDERDLDNLPVAQNRNPQDVEMNRFPKGVCRGTNATPHRMTGLTSIGGKWVCIHCNRPPVNPNRPVNRVKSVNKNAFKKVKKLGLDGKEYFEMVPKSAAEMLKESKIDESIAAPTKVGRPPGEGEVEPPATSTKAERPSELTKEMIGQAIKKMPDFEKSKIRNYPLEALDSITNYFDAAPAKSLTDFKKIDKIRKEITKLRTQVETYLGGTK